MNNHHEQRAGDPGQEFAHDVDQEYDQEFSNNFRLLHIAKYLFRLRAEELIRLPPEKGSTFHGAFGHALKRISPFYYQELFEPGNDGAKPKPFVLLPPLDSKEAYPVGHSFTCELTLFGKAEQYFPICHAALEFLGKEMGLGQNRGKFSVAAVEQACPLQSKPSFAESGSLTCQDIAASCPLSVNNDRLTMHLPTRLRLKADGHLLSRAPEFDLFLARLLGRINTLSSLYGHGKMVERELREQLITRARERIQLDSTKTDACWRELPRFSGRQQQWMKFGGLFGSVTWQGRAEDFQPFLPYLAIGEWIHVGGKSSFGLGKYVVGRQNRG
ncbi:MAG: CRISPR system precrRNA processing endoribonuclease RAMP protein Cas6 [Candidatus Electrothrix sp. Rat3]|nr:CRISPR system precrRNA processing endoribonuclease RAMP protein Cas6 [Candidatus Electrothrix rattekaaiensis]